MNIVKIKTVADFKRLLTVGVKVASIFHMDANGRDEKSNPLYKDEDRGEREVTIKQSNCFALKTQKKDGTFQDSFCNYPKASECTIAENKLTIYEEQRNGLKMPILTYWIVAPEHVEQFVILSPDGITIDPTATYSTPIEVKNAFIAWLERYKKQGYYSSRGQQISLSMLSDVCELRNVSNDETFTLSLYFDEFGMLDDVMTECE